MILRIFYFSFRANLDTESKNVDFQNDPRNNDIVIKTELIQNSDVEKISDFDGISAMKTEPGT